VSLTRFHIIAIAGWCTIIVAVALARLVVGAPTNVGSAAVLVFLGCVPPLVMLAVFRGAAPRSMSQIIYDAENPTAAVVPVPARSTDRARS
jgi:hypothetical protein